MQTTYELDGMFSSLKKAVKKAVKIANPKNVHKSHVRAVKNPLKELKMKKGEVAETAADIHKFRLAAEKKIDQTLYGKKLGNKLIKIRHSKGAQAAERVVGTAIASYFVGPVAGKVIGGVFTKAGATGIGNAIAAKGAAMGSGTLMKSVATGLVKNAIPKVAAKEFVRKNASKEERLRIAQAKNQIYAELQIDAANIQKLMRDKEFQALLTQAIKDGKTLDEIGAMWANSDAYQYMVRKEVPRTVQPLIYENMVSQGIPPNVAQRASFTEAHDMVDKAATKIADDTSGKNTTAVVAAIGIPLLLAALGG